MALRSILGLPNPDIYRPRILRSIVTPIGAFLTKRTVGGKEKPTHRPFDERPQNKMARTMGKAKKKSSPRTKLGEISNFVNIGDTRYNQIL